MLYSVEDVLRVFTQIVEAIRHVHSCGLIHRDLKPANIFYSPESNSVVLGDFGLSRHIATIDEDLGEKVSHVD